MNIFIIPLIVLFQLIFIFVVVFIDRSKKRVVTKYPFISFIVPTYNDADTLGDTIDSIYKSYSHKLEVFVVNDCSSDNTDEVMAKQMQKHKNIFYIKNSTNKGKTASINSVFAKTKGELVYIVDSDIILNRTVINDTLARLESNPKVGAVSSRCVTKNTKIFSKLLTLEYSMISAFQKVLSLKSALGLWGASVCIKRSVFEKAGLLSLNTITEDVDLALKIGELGYKVEENTFPVETSDLKTFKSWTEQKIRWAAGSVQAYFKHYKYVLKHSIFMLFFVLNLVIFVLSIFSLQPTINLISSLYLFYELNAFLAFSSFLLILFHSSLFISLLEYLFFMLLGPFFVIPYLYYGFPNLFKKPMLFLLIFPFTLIYLPIFMFVSFFGFIYGGYKFFTLQEGSRGW